MSESPSSLTNLPACPICGTGGSVVGGLCAGCLAATAFGFDEPESLPPGPSEARPERLGNYELLEELGRGGMGVVYRARQLGMEREVALKVIPAGPLADPEFVSRFRTEARLAGKLHHPNIVAIHEVGETDGHAYFSMDLVPGGTLARQIKTQGPFPPRAAAALALKMARALEHAHAASVLHRDLKPANILLDFEGEPHLADFGLAKSFDDVSLTLTAQSLGTPAWLAPEQIMDGKNPTAATDVYGAGAILYFLLTGRPPFPGRTVAELLKQVQEVAPVSPRLMDNTIPRDLETITLRCLEKTRQRRFVSARELALELERFMAGQPILSRPVSVLTHAWRWAVRHKALASALVSLAIVILGSAIAMTSLWLQATASAAAEKKQRQKATDALWVSLLQTAHGQCLTGTPDARSAALESLRRATEIKAAAEVRNEAILALTLPEIRFIGETAAPLASGDHPPALALHPSEKLGLYEWPPGQVFLLPLKPPMVPQRLPAQSNRSSLGLGFTHGGTLAYRGHQAGVDLWQTSSGQPLPIKLPFYELCFEISTNQQDTLAACLLDRQIVLMSLPSGQERSRLPTKSARVMALSPLGNYLAYAQLSEPLKRGLPASGKVLIHRTSNSSIPLVHEITLPQEVACLAWSTDEHRLACGLISGETILLEPASGNECGRLVGHESRSTQLKFLNHDRHLLSTSWDRTTRLWEVATSKLVATTPHYGPFTISQDERLLWQQERYSYLLESELKFPQVARLLPNPTALNPGAETTMTTFSADDRVLFVAGRNYSQAWEVATGKALGTGPGSLSLLPLPDGSLLSSTPDGLRAMAFDGHFGPPTQVGPVAICNHSALSGDGQVAVVTGSLFKQAFPGGLVQIWRNNICERFWDTGMFYPPVATNYDGTLVATGGHQSCRLQLWNTKDGSSIPFASPEANATCDGMSVAMDRSGTHLASITVGHVRLWDIPTRTLRHTFGRNGAASSYAGAFSPDGKLFVATGIDHALWLIDPNTGKQIATLDLVHSVQPINLAFSRDGTKISANTLNRGVLVWDLTLLQQELKDLGLAW